jgi:hypothetical protein
MKNRSAALSLAPNLQIRNKVVILSERSESKDPADLLQITAFQTFLTQ